MEEARKSHNNRMLRVAERENTEVYEYKYDEQNRQASPEACVNLARRTIEAREQLPTDMSQIEAGKRICENDSILREFSENFPKIFSYMLDPVNCGNMFEMLQKFARIQLQVDSRNLSPEEAKVHASRIVIEKTAREPTAEEKKQHNI